MKHKVIDIYFTNEDGRDDKTQFDFNGDWNDTIEVWQTFCEEQSIEFGSISGFDIYEIDEPEYEGDDCFTEENIAYPKCPNCESDNVTGWGVTDANTRNEDFLIDTLHCDDCGCVWERMYRYMYSIKED